MAGLLRKGEVDEEGTYMAVRKELAGPQAELGPPTALGSGYCQRLSPSADPTEIGISALASSAAGIMVPMTLGIPYIPEVPDKIQFGRPMHANTTQVVSAIVYERLKNDMEGGVIDGHHYNQSICEASQWNLNMDSEIDRLRQYDQAIKVVGRRYRHLKFYSPLPNIRQLEDIFVHNATHIAFSGGLITWDGIVFVIIMTAQMTSEYVQAGIAPKKCTNMTGWCIDYFSTVTHHASGYMTVNEWIDLEGSASTISWMTIVPEARLQMDALITSMPDQSQTHTAEPCPMCGQDRMMFRHDDQRPNAQCPFCCTFWCLFQECKFVADNTASLTVHQRRFHRYPSQSRTVCEKCGNIQPHRQNYRSEYIHCDCSGVWCVFDECNESFKSFDEAKAHVDETHSKLNQCRECKSRVKDRNKKQRCDRCAGCEIFWCLNGQCTVEEQTLLDLQRHQSDCGFDL